MSTAGETELERQMLQIIRKIELMRGNHTRQLECLSGWTYHWIGRGFLLGLFFSIAAAGIFDWLKSP